MTMSRVLLVHDCPATMARLCQLLRRWGYDALAINDAEALAAAADFVPDVALVDLAVPGLDGLGLAHQLRGVPGLRDCLLVAVSATPGGRRPPEGDFDLCLSRPMDPEELRRLLVALAAPPAGKVAYPPDLRGHPQLLPAAG